MTRVLLTGATGFIGTHVARALLSRGYEVRALVRDPAKLIEDLGETTPAIGDIRDPVATEAAITGCDVVIHTAAEYSLSLRQQKKLFSTNVTGTANILNAAAKAGVDRVVYTSTVGTLAFKANRLATEDDLAGPEHMTGPYKRSKYEAERVVRRMAAKGLPIVIVKPTFPVGALDRKPTPSGQIIIDFMSGKLPAVVDTGLNVVDVVDVAEGHVLALENGIPGCDYILGNKNGNLTLSQLLYRLADITGLQAPHWKIPHTIASAVGVIDTIVEGILLRREPRVPMEGVRMARTPMWVDPSKSIDELGLPQRSINGALKNAVDWYADNGYIPAARQRNRKMAGKP